MKQTVFSLVISLTIWLPNLSSAESLMDIFELAYIQDTDLRIAESERLIGGEATPLALSVLLPQINANASQLSLDRGNANEFNIPNTSPIIRLHGYDVSLDQSLINISQWYDLKGANSFVSQANAIYIISAQDLLFRVAFAYFNVLATQDLLELAIAERNANGQLLEQTQQFFEVGLVAITDVNEAQARYDLAVAGVIEAENNVGNANEQLRFITGQLPGALDVLVADMPLVNPAPDDVQAWIDTAQTNSPLVLSSQYGVDVASAGVRSAQALHLPSASLTAQAGHERFGTLTNHPGGFSRNWQLMFNISLNIFSGGFIQSNVRTAQYTYQESKDFLEQNKRTATSQTSDAYRAVLTNIGQVNAFQQAVISARTALAATQAAYDVGTRTIFDVLDSIATLYDSETQFAQSRYFYILSQLQLKQAAGLITVADLMEVNELLHPPTADEDSYLDYSTVQTSTQPQMDS